MSHNQSRTERSESTQYRKTGRSGSFNQQRQFAGGASNKGGGGASTTSNPSNRSFNKKYNSNVQGGQLRPRSPNVSSDSSNSSASPAVQNDTLQQQPARRASDSPATSTSANVKPMGAHHQKVAGDVTKASFSDAPSDAQPSDVSSGSESKVIATPERAPGDASKSFPLQFGSLSPGFMNGVQIPARTSSAPPNLDEQRKAQARHESSRAAPALPVPSIPKQQLPKKDPGVFDQTIAREPHTHSKSKRENQVPAVPQVIPSQNPAVHPLPGMHMQLPYHQLQVPVQFGGPNPQIQSHAMSGTSLPMPQPMPLSIGNPSAQQPMFVSSLPPHMMQSQGMMHQGQSLNFSSQMGPQITPQLGNMGMNIAPQFPQQQAGKHSGSRKTVKITHPETHEELRLDSSTGPKPNLNVPPQLQPIPSFPNHPVNFFPNFFPPGPPGISVTLNSSQVPPTSQPPRFYNKVTVKPAVVSHDEKEPVPPKGLLSSGKAESSKNFKLHGEHSVQPQRATEPSSLSYLSQSKPDLAIASRHGVPPGPAEVKNDACTTTDLTSAPMDSSASKLIDSANDATNGVVLDSTKCERRKLSQKGNQDEVEGKPTFSPNLPSQLPQNEVEALSLSRNNLVSGTAKGSFSTTVRVASDVNLPSKSDAAKNLPIHDVSISQSNLKTMGRKEKGEAILPESSKPDGHSLESSLKSLSLESPETLAKSEESSSKEVTSTAIGSVENISQKFVESSRFCSDNVKMVDNLDASMTKEGGDINERSVPASGLLAQNDQTSTSNALSNAPDSIDSSKTTLTQCPEINSESAPVSVLSPRESENEDVVNRSGSLVSPLLSSVKDKDLPDTNVAKAAVPRGKKKRRDLYKKAEAVGTSSDLYNAYKGPEEKKEAGTSVEGSTISIKQTSADASPENAISGEKPAQNKVEPDDWEDAAEISAAQLETLKSENHGVNEDGNGLMIKRYSRDFLLKFLEQCPDLPEGFEITSDIADVLMVSSANVSRESYPSPGRNNDRPSSRSDRRGIGSVEEDKWNKFPGPPMLGRGDMRSDFGYAANVIGLRPGQGGNYGVLRNPRAQAPLQYVGGILSGPMQSLGPQGGQQRNNSDSDRWQRGANFQKGLIPSPQGPMPVIHRAEKKYEVGKVTDEEEAKQRQLKGILNKLTPQNFEKLFEQVKQVNIDNVVTLSGVISQIFDKALMEPTFCEMYANFCFYLSKDLPDLSVDNEKITFKRLLLNKCQEEFERGEREEEEANKEEVEGEIKQTVGEREEKRIQVRRRMLGNIRLIGELYKKKMLTERIMHECITKLLGRKDNPDEENIEALCKLMSTIGEMIDHPRAKEYMDYYFSFMAELSNNMNLSSRVRFMLRDSIDLRKNRWQQRRKVEGPKKIEDVHRDAEQERNAQAYNHQNQSRMGRAPSFGSSVRRAPPMDFAPRAPSMLSSPGSQMGGFRAVSPHIRGYGSQDARTEERHSFENKSMSIPLTQRQPGDDLITLGPQGGLARGMAFRGQQSAPNIPLGDMSSSGDARRMGPGLNGFGTMPERAAYREREDLVPRYAPDRFGASSLYEQSHPQEQYGNRVARDTDSFDRSLPTSPPAQSGPPTSTQHAAPMSVLSEEHLHDKSMTTIKEFYSARDEKEVALCIKDLNTPSFYPSMISVWVTDSFERKDIDRDLLTKLLISLAKPQDGMISEAQLIKGFECVLEVLEDAENDAPRASEFLGRIFAKVIMEDIVSLSKIGRLIYEGGAEQGRLVETGLAAKVIGSVLDIIKSEKGDSVLNEIRSSSNLRLENFRPPGSKKPLIIDKFM